MCKDDVYQVKFTFWLWYSKFEQVKISDKFWRVVIAKLFNLRSWITRHPYLSAEWRKLWQHDFNYFKTSLWGNNLNPVSCPEVKRLMRYFTVQNRKCPIKHTTEVSLWLLNVKFIKYMPTSDWLKVAVIFKLSNHSYRSTKDAPCTL